jgi:hypothetical protein
VFNSCVMMMDKLLRSHRVIKETRSCPTLLTSTQQRQHLRLVEVHDHGHVVFLALQPNARGHRTAIGIKLFPEPLLRYQNPESVLLYGVPVIPESKPGNDCTETKPHFLEGAINSSTTSL